MSVTVSLERLRHEIDQRVTAPYLLTVDNEGRPHCVAVDITWRDDLLLVPIGNRSLANARARSLVSVLWPPNDVGDFSLIVDATVTAANGTGTGDNLVTLQPTRAVLHRPSQQGIDPEAPGCGADCVPLTDDGR